MSYPPPPGGAYPPPPGGAYPPPPGSPSGYGYPPPHGQPAYGAPPPGSPGGYGAPPGAAPGYPPAPGYGAPPPAASPQPAAYGAAPGYPQPPAAGLQAPGYGAPPQPPGSPYGAYIAPGYAPQQPAAAGYGAPAAGYPAAPPQQHSMPPGAYQPQPQPYGAPYHSAPPGQLPTMAAPVYGHDQPGAPPAGAPLPMPRGTVVPVAGFNPEADAQALRRAMKGFGTDETALINILCKRTNAQRQEIRNRYKQVLGRDLAKDLESETRGDFERVLLALMQTPVMYDASELRDALKEKKGTALIEIFVNRSNQELSAVKAQFERAYRVTLEKEVKSQFSGDFERGLLALLECKRDDETRPVDMARVTTDAQNLYRAGEKKVGTDERMFIATLAYRSFAHIRAMCVEYSKICKNDLETSIEREFSGDIRKLLKAIVRVANNPARYYAGVLYKSMVGAGTDDRTLQRAIITRCEIDMVQIKEQFNTLYKKNLSDMVISDCSGDYRKALLALL